MAILQVEIKINAGLEYNSEQPLQSFDLFNVAIGDGDDGRFLYQNAIICEINGVVLFGNRVCDDELMRN